MAGMAYDRFGRDSDMDGHLLGNSDGDGMNRYRKMYPDSPLTEAEAVIRYIRLKRRITNRLLYDSLKIEVILDIYWTWVVYIEVCEFRAKLLSFGYTSKRDKDWYKAVIDEFKECPIIPLP